MKATARPPHKPGAVAAHLPAERAASTPGPSPGLYVVATPIGHRRDITLRALDILAAADLVACEDTRHTGRLLEAHGIRANLTPYHEHNAARARPGLLDRLDAGAVVALVSDAGTPLISDPGYRLVAAARDAGLRVQAIPGPSALTTALATAGLPTDRVHFAGFPPAKAKARREALAALAAIDATLVFYEAPHRLAASLAAMAETLGGERAAVVLRELTKRHEEHVADRLDALADHYAGAQVKGELVVLVAPPVEQPGPDAQALSPDGDVASVLAPAAATLGASRAAAALSRVTGYGRKQLYDLAIRLRSEAP